MLKAGFALDKPWGIPMTTVYFATNRKKTGPGPTDFGSTAVSNDPSAYAVAEVDVTLDDADAGTITSIHDVSPGGFSAAVKNKIIGGGKNLLIFIHGADNSFEDAIKRAAFNREWFAASGSPAADTTIVAFTWPASNRYFTPGHNPRDEYLADQVQAAKSNFQLAQFLKSVDALRGDFIAAHPGKRVFLLTHSMGNFALEGAVQNWFDEHNPADQMFDHVFLAAADVVSDTFQTPHDGRLVNLPKLTKRTTIYYSRFDFLLILSEAVNHNTRLGFNGPDNKADTTEFPPAEFRLVDCTNVLDYLRIGESSHQYYRKSVKVREDFVACMVNSPPPEGGIIVLSTPVPEPEVGAVA